MSNLNKLPFLHTYDTSLSLPPIMAAPPPCTRLVLRTAYNERVMQPAMLPQQQQSPSPPPTGSASPSTPSNKNKGGGSSSGR